MSEKLSAEYYYFIFENFKSFHKSRSNQTQQMKSIPKTNMSFNFYRLPFSTCKTEKQINYININIKMYLLFQISFLSILVCSSLFCFEFHQTNWTVSRVTFLYHSKAVIWSCSAILHRYFSRVMVKRTIFLAQLCMVASSHLINKCDQKVRQVKNQIIKHQIRKKN